MPYFKDTNGKLHFIEDERFSYLLPPGSKKVSDEEAKKIEEKAKPKE
jgi:hypothetical protein